MKKQIGHTLAELATLVIWFVLIFLLGYGGVHFLGPYW